MKRKIFSKLLMVALVIAAVGSFVSCKDYDDDINNLQKQIDAKAALSELTALQSTLDSKIAAAQSAATAAQAKADAAATKTSVDELKKALETAIADAKKAGTDAGTKAGEAITAANKAQETAEGAAQAAKDADAAAKAALADALKTIEETYQTKAAAAEAAEALAAVKATADAAFTKAQAEELKAEVEGLKEDLETAIDEKIDEKIKEVNNAVASVDALWKAVTSIEFAIGNNNVWGNTQILNFQYGKEKDNVFGKATELHAYAEADKYKTYKAGDDIKAENVYLVRVNPVTADLSTASLKLMNSKGENLDEFVNIVAEKYNDILTRAGETGLWKLTVTLKEGIDIEDLQDATHAIIKGNATVSAAVYAFGVNDTEEAAAERYAVTAYDLKPLTNEYAPTATLDFNVNGKAVAQIHNRWFNNSYVKAEDETLARGEDHFELKWQGDDAKGVKVPDTKLVEKGGSDGKTANYAKDGGDSRQLLTCLPVNVNEPIIIDFNAADFTFVDSYYVLYDKDNAIESAPSEWNSWKEYKISGLGVMKKATERLVITVEDEKANGDILGFRLYAVNYDGTLVDPDGKAFYVQVGAPQALSTLTVAATFNANETATTFVGAHTTGYLIKNLTNSAIVECSFADLGYADAITLGAAQFPNTVTASHATNKPTTAANVTVDIKYLKSNTVDAFGDYQEAGKVNEVKYVLLSVRNPEDVIDGATINTDAKIIVNPDDHDKKLAELVFSLKKGTISAATAWGDNLPTWKTGITVNGNTVKLFPNLANEGAAWNTNMVAAGAVVNIPVNLNTYVNNLLTGTATATLKRNGEDATVATYYNATTGVFTIPADEVGSKPFNNNPWKYGYYSYRLTLKAAIAEAVSLTWNAGVTDKSDASVGTTAKAPDTTIFDYVLNFDNVWDYQTYAVEYGYEDGKIGETAAGVDNKTSDKLWLSYANIGTTAVASFALNEAMVDAATAAGKYAAPLAHLDYDFTTNGWLAATATGYDNMATTLTKGENTGVPSYRNALVAADYVSFSNPEVITVSTGAINEFIEYNTANLATFPADVYFIRTATAPATLPNPKEEMKFQFTATDAYGKEHKIQVPFTLVR